MIYNSLYSYVAMRVIHPRYFEYLPALRAMLIRKLVAVSRCS
jgi:hypothetical protein